MRIVQVVPSIAEEASGPTHTVTALCRELTNLGHEVVLHTLAPPPKREFEFEVVYHKRWPIPRRLGVSPSMRSALMGEASTADIIHTHGLWMMPNIYPAGAARKADAKVVASPRGTLGQEALAISPRRKKVMWTAAQGRALSRADLIHATAPAEAREIRKAGIDTPIAVVSNGVDIPSTGNGRRQRTVLYLGRLHPKKCPENLIKSWSRVAARFPDWSLRMVGPPSSDAYLNDLLQLSSSLGADRIQFAGPAYGEKRSMEYEQAGIFVLPTRNENFGVAVAEALAHGVPAIVTKGAPWSAIERHRCGWWIDHGVDPLTSALREAMSQNPDQLAAMGERGRAWMASEFSWRNVAENMVAAYETALSDTGRP